MIKNKQVSRVGVFIVIPASFILLLCILCIFPFMIKDELYINLYLPYIKSEPVIRYASSGMFAMTLFPGFFMLLPSPIVAFLRFGLNVNFAPSQKYIDQYAKILCVVMLLGVALALIGNFFIVSRIEAKGYNYCAYYDHPSARDRYSKGYVIDPTLCIKDKHQRQAALIRYKELSQQPAH